MKCSQMSASLRAYARLLEGAECPCRGSDLEAFATVFDRGGTQTVSAVVKKIDLGWRSSNRSAQHPEPLKAQLEEIASALVAAGATSAAKDYGLVISLFAGRGGASAQVFAEAAIRQLETPRKPPKPPRPGPDPALIGALADKLSAATPDNAKFDTIVSDLKNPRKFPNAVLAAIANRYLGEERTYKSRADILKAIINHQLHAATQASRDRRIAKIAV